MFHPCYLLWGAGRARANLREADLCRANLSGADLSGADLSGANLNEADVRGADLSGADLSGANLNDAILHGAILSGADLSLASLVSTDLRGANLSGSRIYGISAWDVHLDDTTKQANVIITREEQAEISVDSLEIAQFVYLLLSNDKIRSAIDVLTTKAVLILGRFTDDRIAILHALRDALRQHSYVPILFDFNKPSNRDTTETVSTLAHLSRFIVADLTDPKSVPQELATIIPHLRSVPVQPLLLEGCKPWGMFEDLSRYSWVLPTYTYRDQDTLIVNLKNDVILPAEKKAKELQPLSR